MLSCGKKEWCDDSTQTQNPQPATEIIIVCVFACVCVCVGGGWVRLLTAVIFWHVTPCSMVCSRSSQILCARSPGQINFVRRQHT